jgi:hypothetical protein
MYNEFTGTFNKKNKEKFSNDFVCGTPDIIGSACITDVKSSWDIFTFTNAEITKDYDWQLIGYCLLTNLVRRELVYCLNNTPAKMIESEKRKASYRFNTDSLAYIEKCRQIERNHIYDIELFKKENPDYILHTIDWDYDISLKDRIKIFKLPNVMDEQKDKLYNRIIECRNFLNSLNNK